MLFNSIKPMLLQMGSEVVDDQNWIYDIKWDGWRILLHKQGDKIEAFTRHGNVITSQFPELQEAGRSIKAYSAIIDCEGVVLRNGISVFDDFAYRGRLHSKEKIEQAITTHPATFMAFDVLATDKPHLNEPLVERKKRLSSIIEPSNSLIPTPSIEGEGNILYQMTKEKNMEGIVGKRADSFYQINQRSYDWLKYKHFRIAETVILGFQEKPFSMIVGSRMKDGRFSAVANVEFGFKPDEKQAFRQVAKQIVRKKENGVFWVDPVLCCKVQYLEKTENHKLRIVSFKGFSFDKTPEECVI